MNKPVRVCLETLGCKLNIAETELLSRQLAESGCKLVGEAETADIYILNTCTVTGVADRKSRHLLRMARRRNPEARIIAVGCYADSSPQAIAELGTVNLALDNQIKFRIKDLLIEKGWLTLNGSGCEPDNLNHKTRSFIKIQEGCNHFCAYCIVPLVRGRDRSLLPEQIITEIKNRLKAGYREIVLTGTEIGLYKSDTLRLPGLLQRILRETEVERLRLSSLQSREVTVDLIRLWQDQRLCRHFHLSLQSGSDAVLKSMQRGYNTADYRDTVKKIRESIADVSITTDVITGFPGESEKDFEESYTFVRETEFSRIHVFPYSQRPGTPAASLPGQVKSAVKKQRTEAMLALARDSLHSFNSRFQGRVLPVLFEQAVNGMWSGFTDNYIKVYTYQAVSLCGRLIPVKLTGQSADGMYGEIVERET